MWAIHLINSLQKWKEGTTKKQMHWQRKNNCEYKSKRRWHVWGLLPTKLQNPPLKCWHQEGVNSQRHTHSHFPFLYLSIHKNCLNRSAKVSTQQFNSAPQQREKNREKGGEWIEAKWGTSMHISLHLNKAFYKMLQDVYIHPAKPLFFHFNTLIGKSCSFESIINKLL